MPDNAMSSKIRSADVIALRNLVSFFDMIGPTTLSKYLNESRDMRIYLWNKVNVIHTCRNYNLHIWMVMIYWVLTWNIVLYLLQPSLELNCGKFHFLSFVYKSPEPTIFFSFELLVPFSFESFVSVLDNQLQIKCLHCSFSKVLCASVNGLLHHLIYASFFV